MGARDAIVRALIKPLAERRFYDQYSQHLDLRNRANPAAAADVQRRIMEEGFQAGSGVNTLPPYRGGEPRTVVDQKFAPRAGDTVYLVPNTATRETGSGQAILQGWKPEANEVLRIERDFPSVYQEYLRASGHQPYQGMSVRPEYGTFEQWMQPSPRGG